jgi:hypothetical protein
VQFGLFLVERQRITAEQFVEALRRQLAERIPLGQLAIENCLLSVREVFEVLRVQSQGEKDRFGEAAIDLGLLSKSDVAGLLMQQADRRPSFGTILIDRGVLTQEQVDEEMAAFRRAAERRGSTTAFANKLRLQTGLEPLAVGAG